MAVNTRLTWHFNPNAVKWLSEGDILSNTLLSGFNFEEQGWW